MFDHVERLYFKNAYAINHKRTILMHLFIFSLHCSMGEQSQGQQASFEVVYTELHERHSVRGHQVSLAVLEALFKMGVSGQNALSISAVFDCGEFEELNWPFFPFLCHPPDFGRVDWI